MMFIKNHIKNNLNTIMQSNITKSNRIDWIDELKGFILILVCLAHTGINIPLVIGGVI